MGHALNEQQTRHPIVEFLPHRDQTDEIATKALRLLLFDCLHEFAADQSEVTCLHICFDLA